jgi:hypothetical protein
VEWQPNTLSSLPADVMSDIKVCWLRAVAATATRSDTYRLYTCSLHIPHLWDISKLQTILGVQSDFFSSGFLIKILYAFLISLVRALCPADLILLDLITLIILCEAHKVWSSSLCGLLQPNNNNNNNNNMPLITYTFGIIKWTNTDFNNLNILTRTTCTKFQKCHQHTALGRFTLPEKKEDEDALTSWMHITSK